MPNSPMHQLGTPKRRLMRSRAVAGSSLALACALALAGCSGSPQAGGSAGTPGSGASGTQLSGTIKVSSLTANGGTPPLQGVIAGFKKLYPGVNVQLITMPSNTYQTTIKEQLAANHAPDVMFVWLGDANTMSVTPLAKAGDLADLSSEPWAKNATGFEKSLFSYGGKQYAYYGYLSVFGVGYNKDLLSKLGAAVPQTFSELLNFCTTVSSKGVIPIALGNQTAYMNNEVPLTLVDSIMHAQDKSFVDKMIQSPKTFWSSTLWTSSLTKALNEYLQMKDAKCFEDNSTGFSTSAADTLVSTQKALSTDAYSGDLPAIEPSDPNHSYGMFELPGNDNPADTMVPVSSGGAYGVNAHSNNKAAAIAFVNYMATPNQQASEAKVNYGLPYQTTSTTNAAPQLQGIMKLMSAGTWTFTGTNLWPNPTVKLAMEAQDEALILNKTSADKVVAAVQAAITSGN